MFVNLLVNSSIAVKRNSAAKSKQVLKGFWGAKHKQAQFFDAVQVSDTTGAE